MHNEKFLASKRKHICLITYHGYPGTNIPIGGMPDTGGQIIYVNAFARALDKLGYRVSIFTRGGFPYYNEKRMRKGIVWLSEYARYVYVPSGPRIFVPKEDIGNILDEAIDWIYDFVCREAKQKKIKHYNYYWFVSTHYWDGAVIGDKLIKRWQDDLFMERVAKIKFHRDVINEYNSEQHKLNLSNDIDYFTGEIFFHHVNKGLDFTLPNNINLLNYKNELTRGLVKITGEGESSIQSFLSKTFKDSKEVIGPVAFCFILDRIGRYILDKKIPLMNDELAGLNRHAWTPHSLGALKERNYWEKDYDVKRKMKFLERTGNEKDAVRNISVFAATSNEIITVLKNYYDVPLKNIIYFPPGTDDKLFKPRTQKECQKGFKYLSGITNIPVKDLMNKRIIFETSRMDATKRKDLLINAFNLIASQYDDAVLLIGGGPENDIAAGLKAQIKKLKLQKRAFVVGFIPDDLIGEFFSMATVFASASEMEGFGMSVLNAIASGAGVVSSDLIPLTVQYLKHCSIIVPAGDMKGFACGIKKYFDNEKLLKQNIERAYEVSHDFKWSGLTKKMIADLNRLKFV